MCSGTPRRTKRSDRRSSTCSERIPAGHVERQGTAAYTRPALPEGAVSGRHGSWLARCRSSKRGVPVPGPEAHTGAVSESHRRRRFGIFLGTFSPSRRHRRSTGPKIDPPAFPTKQCGNPPVAVATILTGQLHNPCHQLQFIPRHMGPSPLRGPGLTQHSARLPLRDLGNLLSNTFHSAPPLRRAREVFPLPSLSGSGCPAKGPPRGSSAGYSPSQAPSSV